jgi:hypothetical protein
MRHFANGTFWQSYHRLPQNVRLLADKRYGPGQVIRWHYLAYSALALAVMTAAITSHERRFLNFVHVICGVLWTGIDLFMGFVIGPILRRVDITVRREMPALRRGHSGAATQSRPGGGRARI